MSYRTALKRLEALGVKALDSGTYVCPASGIFCALGAVVPATRKLLPGDNFRAIESLASAHPAIHRALKSAGMTAREAGRLQEVNDDFDGPYDEGYAHVISWLRSRAIAEPEALARPEVT